MELSYPRDKQGILEWFANFGTTDHKYFSAHYDRWISTKTFTLGDTGFPQRLTILDMGAHWLHNAYLYAIDGHKLICMDAPDTLQLPSVKAVADAFDMQLIPTKRLEKGEGLEVVPSDSVDIILFCEIIEHLTFNPIPFWKEVYRILKVGGRIIVTTPNSFYYRNLERHFSDMMAGERIGIPLMEIMQFGTYGHHWKEFSLSELLRYFEYLSIDFENSKYLLTVLPEDAEVSLSGISEEISRQTDVRAHNIYLEVTLTSKNSGIVVDPPWIPA